MKIPQITSISLLLFFIFTASRHLCGAQNSPQDYLIAHNAARAQVGVWPLTWDTNLVDYAQQYVNSLLEDCILKHSKSPPYGENIGGGYKYTGLDAVNEWVAEKANYDYGSNSCVGGACRHYTQVVWRDSVRVGCARAKCNRGSVWLVVCYYDPSGNIGGQRPYSEINLSVASTSYAQE